MMRGAAPVAPAPAGRPEKQGANPAFAGSAPASSLRRANG